MLRELHVPNATTSRDQTRQAFDSPILRSAPTAGPEANTRILPPPLRRHANDNRLIADFARDTRAQMNCLRAIRTLAFRQRFCPQAPVVDSAGFDNHGWPSTDEIYHESVHDRRMAPVTKEAPTRSPNAIARYTRRLAQGLKSLWQ